jgi:dTDP-4-amino-4,6-dideoxygalactose transaminase
VIETNRTHPSSSTVEIQNSPTLTPLPRRTVTLPLFPAMQDGDVERVCAAMVASLSEIA